MKKIISLFLVLMLTAGCFSLPVFADTEPDGQPAEAAVESVGDGAAADGADDAADDAADLPDGADGAEGAQAPAQDEQDAPEAELPAAEDPSDDDPSDEAVPEDGGKESEPELFRQGYAYVSGDAAAYKEASRKEKAGTFPSRSAVYASLYAQGSDADADWFRVVFYTEAAVAAGSGYESVYVQRAALTAMSEDQVLALADALRATENLSRFQGSAVPVARFNFAETAGEDAPETVSTRGTTSVTVSANRATATTGQTVILTASVSGASGTVTYKWQKSEDGVEWSSTSMTGYDTNQLTFEATSSKLSNYYRCRVKDGNGTAYSPSIRVTWQATPTVTAKANKTVAFNGDTVLFTATVSNASGTPRYKWQKSTNGTSWSSTSMTGYDTKQMTVSVTEAKLNYYYRCAVTDNNGTWYSDGVKVTWKPTATVTASANKSTAITGDTVIFSAAASKTEGNLTYKWQKSEDGSTWSGTSLTGYNTAQMTVTVTEAKLSYYYRCAVTDNNKTWYSNAVKVTWKAHAVVKVQPDKTKATSGDTVVFTATVTGSSGALTYKWQKSDNNSDWSSTSMTGYNTAQLSVPATQTKLASYYRCIVKDSNGTWYSAGVKVQWFDKPVITAAADRSSALTGMTVKITASPSGTEGNLTYKWQKSTDGSTWASTSLTGSNTATLTIDVTESKLSYRYRCMVKDNNGTWYSNAVKVTWLPTPTVKATPAKTVAVDGTTVSITATAANTVGTVKYQWQQSSNNSNWSITYVSGYSTDTITLNATSAQLGYYFRCAVTDSNGTWYSSGVKITWVAKPTVTATATPTSIVVGNTVTIKATTKNMMGTVTYKWQKSSDGKTWSTTSLTGCKTDTLTFDATDSRLACNYRCAVTDDNGTWYSSGVKVTKLPTPTVTVKTNVSSARTGATVTFTATTANTSGTLTYKWQKSTDGGSTWSSTSLNGYNTYRLSFEASETRLDGVYYRCKVTDKNGTWTSPKAQITWIRTPVITITPNVTEATANTAVTITVKATDTTGSVTYRWQQSTDGNSFSNVSTSLTGYASNVLSFIATQSLLNYRYRCVVTDSNGNWYSDPVKIQWHTPATVTVRTNKTEAYTGDTVTFTATTANTTGSLTYKWQKSEDGVTWSSTSLDGYDTNQLSFSATQSRLSYYYRCRVTDGFGKWYSSGVMVTWKDSVTVTATANCTSASANDSVIFTATVKNATGTVSYRWQQSSNGSSWSNVSTSLSGYASNKLSFSATQALLNYSYRCAATVNGVTWYSNAVSVKFNQVTYRALCIGNNAYKGDSVYCTDNYETIVDGGYVFFFRALSGCVNDMNAMAGMLRGLNNSFSVTTRQNATAADILNAIPTAFAGATDNDVSLFYYSGHGFGSDTMPTSTTMKNLQGGLCGVDAEIVKLSELRAKLSQVKGKIIIILDCCHSGAAISDKGVVRNGGSAASAFNSAVIEAFAGYTYTRTVTDENGKSSEFVDSKYMVISACKYLQTSQETTFSGYNCGVFTYYLLKGLGCSYPNGAYSGSMPADTNSDLLITLYECYNYAKTNASNYNSGQTALYYGTSSTVIFRRK